MMKRFLTAITAMTMFAVPVYAEHTGGHVLPSQSDTAQQWMAYVESMGGGVEYLMYDAENPASLIIKDTSLQFYMYIVNFLSNEIVRRNTSPETVESIAQAIGDAYAVSIQLYNIEPSVLKAQLRENDCLSMFDVTVCRGADRGSLLGKWSTGAWRWTDTKVDSVMAILPVIVKKAQNKARLNN